MRTNQRLSHRLADAAFNVTMFALGVALIAVLFFVEAREP